jgi:hypothetical protein
LVLFSRKNLSQDAAHNLPRACLGQIIDCENSLGRGKWSNRFAHLEDEIFLDLIAMVETFLQGDKGIDSLSGKLIADTNDSCFSDRVYDNASVLRYRLLPQGQLTMLDKSRLNLGSRQSVTRNVDNVVNTTSDPIVSFVISASTIASELEMC